MGNAEATVEPTGAVETKRGASVDPEQLQRDYDAVRSIRLLAEQYGTSRRQVTYWLKAAGIELQKRGSNGSQHTAAWYEAMEVRRTERGDEINAIMAKAREARWTDAAQHERQSERMQDNWDNDPEWRDRHMDNLRRMWEDPARPLGRQWDDPAQRERQRQAWLSRLETTRRGRPETPPGEVALHNALKRASVSFTTSAVILNGTYIVDVQVHQQPLVIEADGVSHRIGGTVEHDAERSAAIEAAGFKIARFTYAQLAKDADECVASLGLLAEDEPVFDVRRHMDALHELRRIRNGR